MAIIKKTKFLISSFASGTEYFEQGNKPLLQQTIEENPALKNEARDLAEVIVSGEVRKSDISKDRRGFHYNERSGTITDKNGRALKGDELFEQLFALQKKDKIDPEEFTPPLEQKKQKRKFNFHDDILNAPFKALDLPAHLIESSIHAIDKLGRKKYSHIFIGDTNHDKAAENLPFIINSLDIFAKTGTKLCVEFSEESICASFNYPKTRWKDLTVEDITKNKDRFISSLQKDFELQSMVFSEKKKSEEALNEIKEISKSKATIFYELFLEAKRTKAQIIFGEKSDSIFYQENFKNTEDHKKSEQNEDLRFQRNTNEIIIAFSLMKKEEREGTIKNMEEFTKKMSKPNEKNIKSVHDQYGGKEKFYEKINYYENKFSKLDEKEKQFLFKNIGANMAHNIVFRVSPRDEYLYNILKYENLTTTYRGYGHTAGSDDLDNMFKVEKPFSVALFKDAAAIKEFYKLYIDEYNLNNKELEKIKNKAELGKEFDELNGFKPKTIELPEYFIFSEKEMMYKTEQYLKNNPEILSLLESDKDKFDKKSQKVIESALKGSQRIQRKKNASPTIE